MEKLNKTVTIACLIYGLYGLVSWLDLGTFVPPIPLKPFLFLWFLVAFIYGDRPSKYSNLSIVFLIWLTSLMFLGEYLVETFFDFEFVTFYMKTIEPFILIGSVFTFIVFVFLFLRSIGSSTRRVIFLLLFAGLVLILTVYTGKQFVYGGGIAVFALVVYVFTRNTVSLSETTQRVQIVLNGVAVLNVLEQMAFTVQ